MLIIWARFYEVLEYKLNALLMKTFHRRMWFALAFASALSGLALRRRRVIGRRAFLDRPATALITGGSSGIGAEFARQLAARRYDLVLVARRAERLQSLAAELHERYGIKVESLVADLQLPADVERVTARIRDGNDIALLVNNAGFGVPHSFRRGDPDRQVNMIQVHVIASVRLARAALPNMIEQHRGAIINVSSTAAFVPVAAHPIYAATKAFLTTFSESLAAESRSKGVRVQALCPGFVRTEFHKDPQHAATRSGIPSWLWLRAEDVVRDSLAALDREEVVCIPDVRYKFVVLVARLGIVSFAWRFVGRRVLRRAQS